MSAASGIALRRFFQRDADKLDTRARQASSRPSDR
jgi:hypothetical protein